MNFDISSRNMFMGLHDHIYSQGSEWCQWEKAEQTFWKPRQTEAEGERERNVVQISKEDGGDLVKQKELQKFISRELKLGVTHLVKAFYFCLIFFFTLFLMACLHWHKKKKPATIFLKKITSLDPHSLQLLPHFSALCHSYPSKRVVTI